MIDVAGMKGPCEVKPIHIENHVIDLRTQLAAAVEAEARMRAELKSVRQAVLTEALNAVESERLDLHEEYMLSGVGDSDNAYSQAIDDAERSIKLLLAPAQPVKEE